MMSEGHDAPLGTFAVALWRRNELTLLLPPTIWLDHGRAGRSAPKRSFMMNHTFGWMDGGMGGGIWIWTVIAVLVVVLLVVVINKVSNKKS